MPLPTIVPIVLGTITPSYCCTTGMTMTIASRVHIEGTGVKPLTHFLPKSLQKAFDLVRIIGNNAVHPGVINIQDNPAIAYKMFELLNMIVEKMITEPKEIESFYNDTIPENQKQAIDKRDSAFKK